MFAGVERARLSLSLSFSGNIIYCTRDADTYLPVFCAYFSKKTIGYCQRCLASSAVLPLDALNERLIGRRALILMQASQ